MALTSSPTTTFMFSNSRGRSRSREHTGLSRSRSRSRDSAMTRFPAGGRTRRRHVHISSSDDDVVARGIYSDTTSHSSDWGRTRGFLSNSDDSGEQSPRSPPLYEEEEPEIGNSTQSETAVVLSEPGVLDCPICLDPLSPPVYQCEEGHLACGSCSSNNEGTCPSCTMPIWSRCRGIEKVLESAKAPCRYREHGCNVTISYSQKFTHERSCKYTVCSCPHFGCNYVNFPNLMYAHFSDRHSDSVEDFQINTPVVIELIEDTDRIFLQEKYAGTLFVLNRYIEPLGSLFNVVCVAPPSSDANYTYKLTAWVGEKSLCLRSYVEVTTKCSTQAPKQNCLLVTNDFTHNQRFRLQLCILSSG